MKSLKEFAHSFFAIAVAVMVMAIAAGTSWASEDNLKPGDVQISGAINETFTPTKSEAGALGDKIIINLYEKTIGRVSLALPPNTRPGTYVIGDRRHKPEADFSGEYDLFGSGQASYLSTAGSLVLTFTSSMYSGYFRFQAVHDKDATKSIWVIGSFTDVPFKTK